MPAGQRIARSRDWPHALGPAAGQYVRQAHGLTPGRRQRSCIRLINEQPFIGLLILLFLLVASFAKRSQNIQILQWASPDCTLWYLPIHRAGPLPLVGLPSCRACRGHAGARIARCRCQCRRFSPSAKACRSQPRPRWIFGGGHETLDAQPQPPERRSQRNAAQEQVDLLLRFALNPRGQSLMSDPRVLDPLAPLGLLVRRRGQRRLEVNCARRCPPGSLMTEPA